MFSKFCFFNLLNYSHFVSFLPLTLSPPGLYLFVQVIATFSVEDSKMKFRHYLLIGWGEFSIWSHPRFVEWRVRLWGKDKGVVWSEGFLAVSPPTRRGGILTGPSLTLSWPPTGQEGDLPQREVSLPPGGQNPITPQS